MTKLYAYTDESGVGATPFVVAVVVVRNDRDVLSDVCQQVELETGKGRTKWAKANYDKRLSYVRTIVNDMRFRGALCFVSFEQVSDYDTATVSAIARAIERADPKGQQKVAVFVDGLNDKKQKEYSTLLRQQVESFVEAKKCALTGALSSIPCGNCPIRWLFKLLPRFYIKDEVGWVVALERLWMC